jgi:hypothetical protein
MSGVWIFFGVLALVACETLLISLVLKATIGRTFSTLAEKYPPVEPGSDAVERKFQSFKFGAINAGLSVHVAVDSDYLHLRPARVLWWVGAREISVPWDVIDLGAKRGYSRRATIGSLKMIGPAWALDLAEPDTS